MFGLNLTALVGAAAAVVILGLGIGWKLDHAHQKHVIAGKDAAIVSYRADLATCRSNTDKLSASIEAQNAAYTAMSDQAAIAQRNAQEAVSAQRRATEAANKRAASILAMKPKGATACERVDDVAAAIRKDMQ